MCFVAETWTLDGGTGADAGALACAETSLAQAHSAIACTSCHTSGDATTSCTTCHASEAAMTRGMLTSTQFMELDRLFPPDALPDPKR